MPRPKVLKIKFSVECSPVTERSAFPPRCDANPRNLRVGQQRLAHTFSRIVDSDGVGLILRHAVFPGRAKGEDVPVKQIDFYPAILRVLYQRL